MIVYSTIVVACVCLSSKFECDELGRSPQAFCVNDASYVIQAWRERERTYYFRNQKEPGSGAHRNPAKFAA